jgi:hypothetical protein
MLEWIVEARSGAEARRRVEGAVTFRQPGMILTARVDDRKMEVAPIIDVPVREVQP